MRHTPLLLAAILLAVAPPLVIATETGTAPQQGPAAASSIIVSQGGASVSFADVDAFAAGLPEDKRAAFFSPDRIEKLLRNLLMQKQLANVARSQHLQSKPVVQAQVRQAEDKVLAQAEIRAHKDAIEVPDLEPLARERFQANPSVFKKPASVNVRHILISTKQHADAQAKKLAQDLHTRLEADPDTFPDLVQQYSEDPSKSENHGLITQATSAKLQPSFADAARQLKKVGQISPVIKTPYGYHILRLVSRTPARQPDFEELRAQLTKRVRKDFIADKMADYLGGLRNKPLDANKQAVAALRTRYAQEPASSASTGTAGK